MNRVAIVLSLALSAMLVAVSGVAGAQESFVARLTAHNSNLGALQPSWIVPLVTPEPRLIQYARVSVSHEYTAAHAETVSYGNGRGFGVVSGNRFEFDYVQPAYIQHNTAGAMDGFGDTSTLVKYRIASGNAKHGNFDVAAILSHSFATGSYKNGAVTDSFSPTVAGGYAFRRLDVISSLGGCMPTGKIAAQGRSIAWNVAGQVHASRSVWFEIENNATYYFSGTHDGKMQNFVTPAAFYVLRRKEWKSMHPFLIFDAGMQVATSGFHTYDHNLISETRILF